MFASEIGTAGNVQRYYWKRRRSAASVEAFRVRVLCMLGQKDRGRCTVFMGARLGIVVLDPRG